MTDLIQAAPTTTGIPCAACDGSGAVPTQGLQHCRVCGRSFTHAEAAALVVSPCTHVKGHAAPGIRCEACAGTGEVEQETPATTLTTGCEEAPQVDRTAPSGELRLSPDQAALLADLWQRQTGGTETVPWAPSEGRSVWGAVQRASMSRTLKRLEERGLARRLMAGGKTVGVTLTGDGRAAAERLATAGEGS